MTRVEFLWFDGCPNHVLARALLDEVIAAVAPGTPVDAIDASDSEVAAAHRFPGSPTIRVDGIDIDPTFVIRVITRHAAACSERPEGLRGIPPREWIEEALSGGHSSRGT